MTRSRLSRWSIALVLGSALAPVGASADGGRPEIQVSTVAELYAAVQPENAGAIVHLAPGTYTLEPTRPNAGRLVLPRGMDLIGARRQRGLESRIVVPAIGAGPGAIRIGDHNVVRWITVEAAVLSYPPSPLGGPFAVGACFDVNVIPPAPAGMSVELTDCIAIGATRGIRIQHLAGAANGRSSTVVLERNEARDQGDSFGLAIQIQNLAPGSTIDASLRKNRCSGTRVGLFVVSLGVIGATNTVRSQGNVYAENVAGIVLDAGRDSPTEGGGPDGANGLELTSIGDEVTDNVGETPDGAAAGGITAIGGLTLSALARTSAGNHLRLTLRGTTFSGNLGYGVPLDVAAFGGFGVGMVPNGGNRVEVRLDDVTTEAPGTFVFSCSEPGQPTDDPPNELEVVIVDEPVDVDCD
jgi:hypothetical protein